MSDEEDLRLQICGRLSVARMEFDVGNKARSMHYLMLAHAELRQYIDAPKDLKASVDEAVSAVWESELGSSNKAFKSPVELPAIARRRDIAQYFRRKAWVTVYYGAWIGGLLAILSIQVLRDATDPEYFYESFDATWLHLVFAVSGLALFYHSAGVLINRTFSTHD